MPRNASKENEDEVPKFIFYLLLIIAVTFASLSIYFYWTGNTPHSALGLCGSIMFFMASMLDKFEFIKGLGIEAKTKSLDGKIKEANIALARIRSLAALTGEQIIFLTNRAGRLSAPSVKDNYEISQKIRQNLEELETSEARVRDVLSPWVKITIFDLCHKISRSLAAELSERRNEVESERYKLDPPYDDQSPSHVHLNERINTIARLTSKLDRLYDFGADEMWRRLGEYIVEAPELTQNAKDRVIGEYKSWESEVAFLLENYDLKNKIRWFEQSRYP